ncbi:MAG TPA: hypothetical protein VH186_31255 [Chloroflexia bacterium]|nr:hypothetical protein [Chloroflexia bacterium]
MGMIIVGHFVPFLFDDTESTITSLIVLNLMVFIFIVVAMLSIRDQRRQERIKRKNARLAARMAEVASANSPAITSAVVEEAEKVVANYKKKEVASAPRYSSPRRPKKK